MGRLNGRQRDAMWERVAYREVELGLALDNLGEHCRGCGRAVAKHRGSALPVGCIDCVDNSGDHRDIANLQILCRACNRLKNPKRGGGGPGPSNMTASEQTNRAKEWRVRRWVMEQLEGGPSERGELEDAAAERFAISTATVARYVRKMVSREGFCKDEGGMMMFKDESELPFRLKDD